MLDPWPSTAVLLAARKRVYSVVHRTSLLQIMASERHLGAHQRGFARKYTHAQRSRAPTERWHPRHPIGEDHQRRRYSGLRWGDEAQRQKAASIGRYVGYGAQSQGALVEPARSVQRFLWCLSERPKRSLALSICGYIKDTRALARRGSRTILDGASR